MRNFKTLLERGEIPFCADCKHHSKGMLFIDFCHHPMHREIDIVTGKKTKQSARCKHERTFGGQCGPFGDRWESKESQTTEVEK